MSEDITKNDESNIEPENKELTLEEKEAKVAQLNAIIERKTEKVKILNDALKDEPEKETPEIINPSSTGNEQMNRLELKVDGYPDEIIDEIMKYGGKQALQSPIIKRVVGEMMDEHNADRAANISVSNKSDWEKKFTHKDLQGKSIEELEKILPHA